MKLVAAGFFGFSGDGRYALLTMQSATLGFSSKSPGGGPLDLSKRFPPSHLGLALRDDSNPGSVNRVSVKSGINSVEPRSRSIRLPPTHRGLVRRSDPSPGLVPFFTLSKNSGWMSSRTGGGS